MENGNVETLCTNDAEAGVGISQHQHGIGLYFYHQLVALGDDVAHRLAQVIAHCLHVDVRILQFEVLEEDTIEVIVVVLTRVRQQAVKVLPTLVNHRRKTDNLWSCSYYDEKL